MYDPLDHRRLGISFPELGALLGTRALLVAGALEHPGDPDYVVASPTPGEHTFNMNVTCTSRDCGTVSCIGGTMALIMGMSRDDADTYVRASDRLHELFYPQGVTCRWEAITNEIAVEAIDRFLMGVRIDWPYLTRDLPQA